MRVNLSDFGFPGRGNDRVQVVRYAITAMSCRCQSPGYRITKDGSCWCKRCGYTFRFVPEMMFRSREDLIETVTPATSPSEQELMDEIEGLRGNLSDIQGRNSDLESALGECRSRLSELESSNTRLSDEAKGYESRVNELTESILDMDRRLSEDSRAIADLEQTNLHLRSDLGRATSLDLRSIVTVLIDYVTAVDNTVLDSDDPEHIRRMVDARGEKLVMDLRSHGLRLGRGRRGSDMGDDRMDVHWTRTADESENRKVARFNRYGCEFRDSLFPGIVQDITVYLHEPEPVAEPDVSGCAPTVTGGESDE